MEVCDFCGEAANCVGIEIEYCIHRFCDNCELDLLVPLEGKGRPITAEEFRWLAENMEKRQREHSNKT